MYPPIHSMLDTLWATGHLKVSWNLYYNQQYCLLDETWNDLHVWIDLEGHFVEFLFDCVLTTTTVPTNYIIP